MMKKLNTIGMLLGISAFVVGLIGMVTRNRDILPVAGIIFVLSVAVYLPVLFNKKK